MFNIEALIKLINVNKDHIIQKSELTNFLQGQNQSVFTNYFETIQGDIGLDEFACKTTDVYNKYNTEEGIDLSFKDEEDKARYEEIKYEREMYQEMYNRYAYKFKTDEEFNSAYNELLSKISSMDEFEFVVWSGLDEMTRNVDPKLFMERLNTKAFEDTYVVASFQNIVFEDVDLSKYTNAFRRINFNEKTFAKVSPEHLPEGFNPQEVFEKGKSIGLGIADAHSKGYKGDGVSYAIIDSGVKPHKDIKFKEYRVSEYAQPWVDDMHGSAVSYIAQEIAPNADCYYYAQQNGGAMDAPVLDNLKAILERNKTLPDDNKIRFVSMSMPLYGGEEAKKVAAELEAQGVWVFYSSSDEEFKFGYLEKINPKGDSNDFNNYKVSAGRKDDIYVNSGDRTVPDPSGPDAYRHDCRASQSWSVPVISGYYVLACQADPTMTKDRFIELAGRTAQIKQSTVYDNEGNRTEEEYNIKILDINALLEAIEAEKK